MILLWATLALADEPPADVAPDEPKVRLRASGHVKTFSIAIFPFDHPLLPDAPTGQNLLDARLNVQVDLGERVEVLAAHHVTPTFGVAGGILVADTGVMPIAPELLPLSYSAGPGEGGSLSMMGRTDRLRVKFHGERFDVVVGRQPISFGTGRFFTPLDLVNPFTPATIDTEYKPGVDAIRLDLYHGMASRLTLVTSWAGDPITEGGAVEITDFASAIAGQSTLGTTDLMALAGLIRGDVVLGGGVEGALGPVSVYGDAAFTLPYGDEDPFVRATVGASHRFTERFMLSGEAYLQTIGTASSENLLTTLQGDRFARGELWLAGLAYAGLAATFEITPLIHVGAGSFLNLTDGSVLGAPSLTWSIADNAELAAGGFVGLGRRPQTPALPPSFGVRSEFGLYPAVGFVSGRAWF
ncbi:MAG: hypothetical protein EA397_07995 [Deltaproteobacteria bacterium]|nr:MAG: hypothetical protein EA397_07995 [Deltaproteobacteria bacterium]